MHPLSIKLPTINIYVLTTRGSYQQNLETIKVRQQTGITSDTVILAFYITCKYFDKFVFILLLKFFL